MSEAPFRAHADALFASGEIASAITCYQKSLSENEAGTPYTLINLGYALTQAAEHVDICELESIIDNAFLCRNQDIVYYNAKIAQLAFVLAIYGKVGRYESVLRCSGFTSIQPEENSGYISIAGFPRCGTTALSSSLFKAGIVHEGCVAEPFTIGLGHASVEAMFELFKKTFWLSPGDQAPRCDRNKWYIEKSTHWLMSRDLIYSLIRLFPSSTIIIVCIWDPVERAFSAYRYSLNMGGLVSSLRDVIEIETRIIADHGGVDEIFSSDENFISYNNSLLGSGIRLPVLYPSCLISRFDRIIPVSMLSRMSFVDVGRQLTWGKPLPSEISALVSSKISRRNMSTGESSLDDDCRSFLAKSLSAVYPS